MLSLAELNEENHRKSPFPLPYRPSFLPGELQYSPAVLQQRMSAELHYLESIEESVRQLGDVEKLMGVSMAQQESASLAQILKVKELVAERNTTSTAKLAKIQCFRKCVNLSKTRFAPFRLPVDAVAPPFLNRMSRSRFTFCVNHVSRTGI